MHEKEVRLCTVGAWLIWSLGLVGIGLGFLFGPNVGHIGVAFCLLGQTLVMWNLTQTLQSRERSAFEIGRDWERAAPSAKNGVAQIR